MKDGWHLNHIMAAALRHFWLDVQAAELWGIAAMLLANMFRNLDVRPGTENMMLGEVPQDYLWHQKRYGNEATAAQDGFGRG